MKRALRLFVLVAALTACAAMASAARASELSGIGATGFATGLVRGGAPLPQFNSSFPIDLGNAGQSTKDNLAISLTSPDHSVLHFLFSPRTLTGAAAGFGPTVTGSYAGLAWNMFDTDRLFGSIAFSGVLNRLATNDPTRQLYAPLFSLHSTLEFGYELGAQQSLSLALDHSSPAPLMPYGSDRVLFGDYLRLGYGVHF